MTALRAPGASPKVDDPSARPAASERAPAQTARGRLVLLDRRRQMALEGPRHAREAVRDALAAERIMLQETA